MRKLNRYLKILNDFNLQKKKQKYIFDVQNIINIRFNSFLFNFAIFWQPGIACHQFLTSDKDNLTVLFNEMERTEEEDEVNVLDRIQSKHIFDGINDIRNHHFG